MNTFYFYFFKSINVHELQLLFQLYQDLLGSDNGRTWWNSLFWSTRKKTKCPISHMHSFTIMGELHRLSTILWIYPAIHSVKLESLFLHEAFAPLNPQKIYNSQETLKHCFTAWDFINIFKTKEDNAGIQSPSTQHILEKHTTTDHTKSQMHKKMHFMTPPRCWIGLPYLMLSPS